MYVYISCTSSADNLWHSDTSPAGEYSATSPYMPAVIVKDDSDANAAKLTVFVTVNPIRAGVKPVPIPNVPVVIGQWNFNHSKKIDPVPVPNHLFAVDSGTTGLDGTFTTVVHSNVPSQGWVIFAQAMDSNSERYYSDDKDFSDDPNVNLVDQYNWALGAFKTIMVVEPKVTEPSTAPGGLKVYAVDESGPGDQSPPVGFTTRALSTLRAAHEIYRATWGFRALALKDGPGYNRVVISNRTKIAQFLNKIYTDIKDRSDVQCFSTIDLVGATLSEPNVPDTEVEPNQPCDALILLNFDSKFMPTTPEKEPDAFADHGIAHELFHSFQFRYRLDFAKVNEPALPCQQPLWEQGWLFESTADWAPNAAFKNHDGSAGGYRYNTHYAARVCGTIRPPNTSPYPGQWFPKLNHAYEENVLDNGKSTYPYTRSVFWKNLTNRDFSVSEYEKQGVLMQKVFAMYAASDKSYTPLQALQAVIENEHLENPTGPGPQNLQASFRNFAYNAWIKDIDPELVLADIGKLCRPKPIREISLKIPGSYVSPMDPKYHTYDAAPHLIPLYNSFSPDSANTAPGTLSISVSGSNTNVQSKPLARVSNVDYLWRARVAISGASTGWLYEDVKFTYEDPNTHWFGGSVAIPGFGLPSNPGTIYSVATLIMANVTYANAKSPDLAQDNSTHYRFVAKLS